MQSVEILNSSGTEGSSLCLEEHIASPYPEQVGSNPHTDTIIFKIHFYIIPHLCLNFQLGFSFNIYRLNIVHAVITFKRVLGYMKKRFE
jgi:hypothetical protein